MIPWLAEHIIHHQLLAASLSIITDCRLLDN